MAATGRSAGFPLKWPLKWPPARLRAAPASDAHLGGIAVQLRQRDPLSYKTALSSWCHYSGLSPEVFEARPAASNMLPSKTKYRRTLKDVRAVSRWTLIAKV